MGGLPSDRPTSPTVTQLATGPTGDSAARTAGKLLLLSAAGSVVMVAARVGADADQATLTESLRAIADSRPVYTVNGGGEAYRRLSPNGWRTVPVEGVGR